MSSPPPPVQRLRLCYAQRGEARFVGHLDVARFWERVFRRAELPLAYSHGFNPQPKMQFASALPVGVEGENELLDVWVLEQVAPETWLDRIRATLPPDFVLKGMEQAPLKEPAMQSELRLAVYEVRFGSGLDEADLRRRVQALLAAATLIRPHYKDRGRSYDLRPLIQQLDVLAPEDGGLPRLRMVVQSGQQGNARADEVVAALSLDDVRHRITRLELVLAGSEPEA